MLMQCGVPMHRLWAEMRVVHMRWQLHGLDEARSMRDGPQRVAVLEIRQDLGEAVPHRKAGRFAGICILTGRVWMTD